MIESSIFQYIYERVKWGGIMVSEEMDIMFEAQGIQSFLT